MPRLEAISTRVKTRGHADPPPLEEIERATKSIQSALEGHPVLKATESRFFGAKQMMIHPWYAANKLLQVSNARSPAEAVAWLHRVYATTSADLRYVVEVHGLKLNNKIILSNGVQIMP